MRTAQERGQQSLPTFNSVLRYDGAAITHADIEINYQQVAGASTLYIVKQLVVR